MERVGVGGEWYGRWLMTEMGERRPYAGSWVSAHTEIKQAVSDGPEEATAEGGGSGVR